MKVADSVTGLIHEVIDFPTSRRRDHIHNSVQGYVVQGHIPVQPIYETTR